MPNLDGMTYAKWISLPQQVRQEIAEPDWSPQLIGLEGKRVEVLDRFGATRRFWVGRSTGWKPIHLEVKTTRSTGGWAADKHYQSVRVIREGRR